MNLKDHLLIKKSELSSELSALEKFIKKTPVGKLNIQQKKRQLLLLQKNIFQLKIKGKQN